MNMAEKKIWKLVQKSNVEGAQDDKLKKWKTFEDKDGLIKIQTRLFPGEEVEHSSPIVLPSQDELVKKLIWKIHHMHCHAGVGTLNTILREKYWILRSRRTISIAIRSCVKCRRFRSHHIQVPEGPLPKDRTMVGPAFGVTGVDMFGPLHTKGKRKVWVAIFTCATYRAIHLELCTGLTTEVFISALRRFVARRGRPSVIYSDNGLNFVGCNNLLRSLNWNQVLEYANVSQIQWKFNPPTAAWWGGFWERMIGVVKQLLRACLGSSRVTYEELETLLCDVESVVNNRPLTYVSEDGQELLPLTPNHFIHNCGTAIVPDVDAVERDLLVARFRNMQHCRDELRNRFSKEYLSLLVSNGKSRNCREVKVGDIVIVGNDQKKNRIDWPLGLVLEVLPGKDSHVRLARVKTSSCIFLRPVQRLYHLEISSQTKDHMPVINK